MTSLFTKNVKIGTFFDVPLFISATTFWFILLMYFSGFSLAILLSTFFLVTLHEYGHVFASQKLGLETKKVVLYPIGGIAYLKEDPSHPLDEFVISFSGPFVNFVLFCISLPLAIFTGWGESNFIFLFVAINLFIFSLNMIPAYPLDGGRLLRSILWVFYEDKKKATKMSARVSILVCIVLVLLSASVFSLTGIGLFTCIGLYAKGLVDKDGEE